jgi:hypothetical protein
MERLVLSDAAWERMAALIIGRPDQKGSTGRATRALVICEWLVVEIAPADGTKAAIFKTSRVRRSPFRGQLPVSKEPDGARKLHIT